MWDVVVGASWHIPSFVGGTREEMTLKQNYDRENFNSLSHCLHPNAAIAMQRKLTAPPGSLKCRHICQLPRVNALSCLGRHRHSSVPNHRSAKITYT